MDYPVTVERDDNGTMLVRFPDFPEAISYGDDIEDALRHAQDALSTTIGAYLKDRRAIPLPSAVIAKYRVSVPALVSAKIELFAAMQGQRVTKAELARRLKWHGPQVDRLLQMTHGSKLDQMEAAFAVLGKRLVVGVQDVAAPSPRGRRRKFTDLAVTTMSPASQTGAKTRTKPFLAVKRVAAGNSSFPRKASSGGRLVELDKVAGGRLSEKDARKRSATSKGSADVRKRSRARAPRHKRAG
jgi:antitoxin HicB